jgi:glucose-6-phosphate isomerase
VNFLLGPYEDAAGRRVAGLAAEGAARRMRDRDATFWGGDAARQASVRDRLGWLDAPHAMREHLDDLREFAGDVRAGGFSDVVLLGMGGSSLAPEVLRQTIGHAHGHPALHVLDTTDPAAIRAVSRHVDAARTLFFVSSKSGGTIEVATLFDYFWDVVSALKAERAGENFVAITDEGTSLQRLASERGFRRAFVNAPDIGGRYSALSYFGLAPAAAIGIDVASLLERGAGAADAARAGGSDALRLGVALGELALAGRDKLTFVTTPELAPFGLWLEQLVAESTGKEGRGIVPVAGEQLGSPAGYGDDRVFVQLRLEAIEGGELDALVGAISAEGHPLITVDLDDFYDLGREFFRWEFAVAVAGQVLGINPFDEPSVKESKDNTARVLRSFEESGALDSVTAEASEPPVALVAPERPADGTLADAIAALLRVVEPGDYLAIMAYLRQTDAADAAFTEIRTAVREAAGIATTLGYGPRFLHSTGQLHKGGPPRGVFLQVTATDAEDVAIPGRAYTFGQLKRAQAIGDFESLAARGRPLLRVHLGADVDSGLARLRDAALAAVASGATRR